MDSLVKDMMIAVEDYATVAEDATLAESMVALEEAQERHQKRNPKYKHRALLVVDKGGKIVGKLSMIDVLRAFAPNHQNSDALSRLGFSQGFVDTTVEEFEGLQAPLSAMCWRVANVRVGEIMTELSGGEYVDEEATLETAIQQIINGSHQSLLVRRGEDVVGILRLADVFHAAFEALQGCA